MEIQVPHLFCIGRSLIHLSVCIITATSKLEIVTKQQLCVMCIPPDAGPLITAKFCISIVRPLTSMFFYTEYDESLMLC